MRFSGVAGGLLLAPVAYPFSFLATSAAAFAMSAPSGVAAAVAAAATLRLRAVLHEGAASGASSSSNSRTSNSTHCGWIDGDDGSGSLQTMDEARAGMTKYLWQNIMPYDVPRARTLGFDQDSIMASLLDDDENNNRQSSSVAVSSRVMKEKAIVDGLSDGIVNQTLHYSLRAKALYPWTDAVPRSIYMEYVVPYAVTNEPRSDHRSLLFDALGESLKSYERSSDSNDDDVGVDAKNSNEAPSATTQTQTQTPREQIGEVVKLVNTRLWSILGRNPDKPIVFSAGLTPRIYDPLSVVAYGHSSCTGLAVLLVSALRSVGIPARMAGTPAWHGDPDKGNHSWVEVWVPSDDDDNNGGEWIFLEPTPGIAEGEEDTKHADDLDRDPCKRWFCKARLFDGLTRTFATRFDRDGAAGNHYPMAWSGVDDVGVPGEDRSEYYDSVCGHCQ